MSEQIAKKPPRNDKTTTKSLRKLYNSSHTRRSSPVQTTVRRSSRHQLTRGRRSSIAIIGFENHQKEHRSAHISLWHAGRGPAPSLSSSSRSGHSGRRRRGEAPDLPAADHQPSTRQETIQSTVRHKRATVEAPAHLPPSPRWRWRGRRPVADGEEAQKSIAQSPPHRRPPLDT